MTKTRKDPKPRDIEPLPTEPIAMPAAPRARHHLRFARVPAGFIRYRGKGESPIGDDHAVLELVIRTVEGLGFAGPRKVHPEEWTIPASEHGSIAAYRLDGTAPRGGK